MIEKSYIVVIEDGKVSKVCDVKTTKDLRDYKALISLAEANEKERKEQEAKAKRILVMKEELINDRFSLIKLELDLLKGEISESDYKHDKDRIQKAINELSKRIFEEGRIN